MLLSVQVSAVDNNGKSCMGQIIVEIGRWISTLVQYAIYCSLTKLPDEDVAIQAST